MSERLRVRKFGRALTGVATLVAIAGLTLSASASAEDVEQLEPLTPAPTAGTGAMTNELGDLWFVELSSPPAADGTSAVTLKNEKAAFRAAAKKAGLAYTERYAFDTLWNGLSIRIAPSQIGKLARIPGVAAVYPVATVQAPETSTISPELATALAMTGADVAQASGYTGAGIKVAIMDTGIDHDHPDLGGPGFPNARIIAGTDFVGDAFNASAPGSTPVPDDNPDDCNGHGTHVAGIVGASGAATGVAPDVQFGAYRVFGCVGSTTADIMIAAMEAALADDMDVLNMSIGSAFNTWPQYPTAAASDRLVNAGVSVVASIGNSGANGVYSAGAPGVGRKVIGVASFDNSHINALTFNVNPGGQQVAYLPLATTTDPPTSGTTPEVVYVGRGCNADAYLGNPAGKVALIDRGVCTFQEKYQRAANAGATAVLIANNVPGLFAGGGVTDRGIPGVGISLADGNAIKAQLPGATLTWTNVRINAPNPTGGLISSFSSYGLNAELDVKPDIGAPGGLIRSTYPLELGGYAIISGTSMSSPHTAGAVALLLQAKPNTPAQAVRSILQNSADPKVWWGNPGLGFLDNVHRQGAGMVDIPGAINATTTIEPGKLALGESEAGPQTRTLTIENNGSSDATYTLSHVPALSTRGSTFAPIFTTGFASVAFSAPSVTVPAGGTGSVDVTITANPALANLSQYGGYIILSSGSDRYRVPYAGFTGDYQSIAYLADPFGGPFILAADASDHPAPFTMTGGDIPYLWVHLNHQARKLRAEVKDAATGKSWHRALDLAYLARNSTATSFFAIPIDGTTVAGNKAYTVPDGTYVLEVSVQKALGDDANPAHWETWTSPAFTIDRP